MRTTNAHSLTEDVYVHLRADILAGRIPPGAKLNMTALRAESGVSLGVIREALVRLGAEGFLITQTQRGFRVPPIDAKELVDLAEARVELECLCLRSAIAEGDLDWEARIVGAYRRLSRLQRRTAGMPPRLDERWSEAHALFHGALVHGAKNSWLLRMRDTLFTQSERYRQLSAAIDDARRDFNGEHYRVMEAVLARDAEQACEEMRRHLSLTVEILLEAGVCVMQAEAGERVAVLKPDGATGTDGSTGVDFGTR
jgi:GntR family transcriptional regulator, carbon starvation induced regulator